LSPAQITIAGVSSQGEDIFPLLGARTCVSLAEALGARGVPLSSEESARIEAAFPHGAATGDRYSAEQMCVLDSKTGA